MSPHDALVDALEVRRRLAQTVVDACDAALAVFRGAAPAPAGTPKPKRDKPARKNPGKRTARPKDVTSAPRGVHGANGRISTPTPHAESQVIVIGKAITAYLVKQELRSADGVVIRREVAKQLGAKPDKDPSFSGNVGNALQRLKTDRVVTRKGTMWTLTEGAGS